MLEEPGPDHATLWKQRFRTPVILWTQVARAAPARGLVASNQTGVYQLHAWDVPSGRLTPLTHRPEGTLYGVLSPDGRHVYYLDDRQGDEIGHYVRVPHVGGEPEDVTPDLPLYSSSSFAMSSSGNLFGFAIVTADGFSLCCGDVEPGGVPGKLRILHRSTRQFWGPAISSRGEIVVLDSTEHTRTRNCSLLALDAASGESIGALSDGPEHNLEAVAFSPVAGDPRLLAISNHTGAKRPVIWNPHTDERVDLALDELEGDIVPLDWSHDGGRLLLCQLYRAVQRLYLYNLVPGALIRLHHPSGSFGAFAGMAGLVPEAYFGSQGEILAHWQDATHPPQLIALDGESGGEVRTVLAAGEALPSKTWRSITFPSSDGQMVQGWLGLPHGEGPFPAILYAHGGPGAVATECFSPESQAWLDHGFAYLSVNYRSSTTFGRNFQEQIWGNPGHREVEDMAAAYGWLVREGIARKNRVLLSGSSYGGYVTLLALGKHPELWAGGIASIAIADWSIQYEDATEDGRKRMEALFEGTPGERPQVYAASSPLTYVDKTKSPVLIIQGRNDTRAPARQMELYEQRMRSLGKSIEVHWFDAGHLGRLARVEQAIAYQELMLRFAWRVVRVRS